MPPPRNLAVIPGPGAKRKARPAPQADQVLLADPELVNAMNRFADAAEKIAEAVLAAVTFCDGIAHRLDALCSFLKRKGPWLLASIPTVLVAVQAISPNAAAALKAAIAVLLKQ